MGKVVIYNAVQMFNYLGKDVSANVKGLLPKQCCILPGKWVALKRNEVWYIAIREIMIGMV